MAKSREIAVGLRQLADKLDAMPETDMDKLRVTQYRYTGGTESRDKFIAELKELGSFEKQFSDDLFTAVVKFGAVEYHLYTRRSSVCTKRTVKKEVEVDEWDCDSILETALRTEGVIA